jgi:hypothetical protein
MVASSLQFSEKRRRSCFRPGVRITAFKQRICGNRVAFASQQKGFGWLRDFHKSTGEATPTTGFLTTGNNYRGDSAALGKRLIPRH